MPALLRVFAFFLVPVLLLGGACVATERVHARFERVRATAQAGCRAYRAAPGHANADVCRTDDFSRALAGFQEARADVHEARAAARRRDIESYALRLAHALDRAAEADDRGSMVSVMMAERIVAEVLDVLEAMPLLDRESVAALLARAHLRSAARPFEAERVHAAWRLTSAPEASILPRPPLELFAIVATLESNATLVEMELAVNDGDVARCERAAADASRPRGPAFAVTTCRRMDELRKTASRLEALKGSGRPSPGR